MIRSFAKSVLPSFVWKKLRSQKIKRMVNDFEAYEVTHDYAGHRFTLTIEDPLARGWYDKPWDKLQEIEFFKERSLLKDARIFDLGAHQGIVAMLLSKEVGNQGRVLAVEANQHNYSCMVKNKNLNNVSSLEPFFGAVGEKNETLEFSHDLNGAVHSGKTMTETYKVNAYTVDHFIENFFVPSIIFMDVEGYEVRALNSAKKAFDNKCHWFIEVHEPESIASFGGGFKDVLRHFPSEKFDCFMGNETEGFKPLDLTSEVVQDRFFLIALAK